MFYLNWIFAIALLLLQELDQAEEAAIDPMPVEDLQGAFILIVVGWIISANKPLIFVILSQPMVM